VLVASDFNKNIGGLTDLAKKGHGFASASYKMATGGKPPLDPVKEKYH